LDKEKEMNKFLKLIGDNIDIERVLSTVVAVAACFLIGFGMGAITGNGLAITSILVGYIFFAHYILDLLIN